jgi:hypothetical protein
MVNIETTVEELGNRTGSTGDWMKSCLVDVKVVSNALKDIRSTLPSFYTICGAAPCATSELHDDGHDRVSELTVFGGTMLALSSDAVFITSVRTAAIVLGSSCRAYPGTYRPFFATVHCMVWPRKNYSGDVQGPNASRNQISVFTGKLAVGQLCMGRVHWQANVALW